MREGQRECYLYVHLFAFISFSNEINVYRLLWVHFFISFMIGRTDKLIYFFFIAIFDIFFYRIYFTLFHRLFWLMPKEKRRKISNFSIKSLSKCFVVCLFDNLSNYYKLQRFIIISKECFICIVYFLFLRKFISKHISKLKKNSKEKKG